MTAARAAIRDALAGSLVGQTAAGSRISRSRAHNIWKAKVPALCVYTHREVWEVWTDAPRDYEIRLDIAVDLFVEKTADGPVDTQLDSLSAEVLDVVLNNPGLGLVFAHPRKDYTIELVPTAVDIGFDARGVRTLGDARITLSTRYYFAPSPGGILLPLLRHEVTWDLAPADGVVEAVDTLQPPP